MRTEDLPSPRIGQRGHLLRTACVQAISQMQISAANYPLGKHPAAADLSAFFAAAEAAAQATGTPALPTFNDLTFSTTFQIGVPVAGTISGATAGSTITCNIPGINVNSANRTYSGTPTGSASTTLGFGEAKTGYQGKVTLVEVLAPAASSGVPYIVPSAFTLGFFPVNLVPNATNTAFTTNYSAANFKDIGLNWYVSPTGSDTTGDGTSGLPWRTPQKAVDTAPTGGIINIAAGRNYGRCDVPTGKSFSFICTGLVIIGEHIVEADVASVAFANGINTVTLSSGVGSGFVDLTVQEAVDPTLPNVTHFQVSNTVASTANVTGTQNTGKAAAYRATPAQFGTSDKRNLTGKFETEIVAWKATAGAPASVAGTGRAYWYGATFVGGASISSAGARMVLDNCRSLGAVGQNFSSAAGFSILYGSIIVGTGAGGQDVIDYGGGSGCEINSYARQGGPTGADNISTCHGTSVMRVNSFYGGSNRVLHDSGSAGWIGIFGCTTRVNEGSSEFAIGCGTTAEPSEAHVAAHTFLGTPANGQLYTSSAAARIFVYDPGSLAGSTTGSGLVIDRTGSRPISDAALFKVDASNLSTLFQDTAGTVPVTANGQTVARVNDSSGSSNGYMFARAGSFTYQTDGTLHWLAPSGTVNTNVWQFAMNNVLEENVNVLIAVQGGDGTLASFNPQGSEWYDYRTGTGAILSNPVTLFDPLIEHYVDAGTTQPANRGALNTAALNATSHVIVHKKANLGHNNFRTATFMGTLTGSGYDGKLFGMEISRGTTDAALAARRTAIGAKAGISI